jgi:hypothetical protein
MDPAYYQAPAGSPEHYAAYEKEFTETGGALFPVPDSPEDSYEVDNAYELAYERWFAANEPQEAEPQDPAGPHYEAAPEYEAEVPW